MGAGGTGDYPWHPKCCPNCDVFVDIEVPNRVPKFFILADATHLPFRDKVFSEVYASHVLEHLGQPAQLLRESHRVLKSYGIVHVWVPNFTCREAYLDPTHRHVFNYLSLKSLITKSGFDTFIYSLLGNRILPSLICKPLFYLLSGELNAKGIRREDELS